jgi:hypothetical protein
MTTQSIKKLRTDPFQNQIKHFIFFLLGIFASICILSFEWPIPLQGTVYRISSPIQSKYDFSSFQDQKESLIHVACLVSPQIVKYIEYKQEITFQAEIVGNNQKNKSKGIITAIHDRPIQNPQRLRYLVQCEIKDSEIILKNGFKARLMKGMKLHGHLYLNRKKIIEFLLDQIDQWLCPSPLRGT